MEDYTRCILEREHACFAVYDGHGGHTAAEYAMNYLHDNITQDDNWPRNPDLAIDAGASRHLTVHYKTVL
jgi:serine/threonine protein phosphatase PrpC